MPHDQFILNTLSAMGFNALNEMQEQAYASIAANNHTQLIAPTGSGKTIAFLLPMLQQIDGNNKNAQVLVVAPTRELIIQIAAVWKEMQTGYRHVVCYGGHRIETEINELTEVPPIVFGTPGRLNDHLERNTFATEHICTLVIDEFDKTLEADFYNQLAELLLHLPNINKQVLVSATTMDTLPDFIAPAEWVHVQADTVAAPMPLIHIVHTPEKDKLLSLIDLLHYVGDTTSIIFVNHREAAERINKKFSDEGIESVYYHGGLQQIDRTLALIKFKNATVNILVASDIAARGIDVAQIDNVIHYHLPLSEESFIHRNGRTSRQGAKGKVYLLQHSEEVLEDYVTANSCEVAVPIANDVFIAPSRITLTVNAGRKNKLNKIDIIGFLMKNASIQKEDVGLIDVLDTISFVAVNKLIWKDILASIRGKKIKGKDYIFKVAKDSATEKAKYIDN
jgi:superfamily II DNA/RNA helicase